MANLNIFLSWSGERSKKIALSLNNWLPRVIQLSSPWMSHQSIEKGSRWASEIGKTLSEFNIGILCITPENITAPWLIFEAGALSKAIGSSKVIPLVMGMTPRDISGPLSQFQAAVFEKDDIFKLICSLNNEIGNVKISEAILKDTFERYWPDLEKDVKKISSIEIEATSTSVSNVINAFSKFGIPDPKIGNHAYFNSGYESHALYEIATRIAQKRLYILGRKNRKLFDKEHEDYFKTLDHRLSSGFDFKILFLCPSSPDYILTNAHRDDDFKDQLTSCIRNAHKVLGKYGIVTKNICKAYQSNRVMSVMVIDDAVVYCPVDITEDGRPAKLTKSPFKVESAKSDYGKDLLKLFNTHWKNACQCKIPDDSKTEYCFQK
ncbi:TIR domain-containing protein [Desulfobacula phenolica]|uniref:TIR domain-containing protein n=1 Tax=Desulfobacula phenolica TaxID=90732 RepID=A0A1H2EC27_9BACT|nr:TIR domain-containing protein [Desulfobacula phenolica]SDT92687.1 TIR domain-containing protein [Desulfobacula phenolica]